jgi:hypothetical protein
MIETGQIYRSARPVFAQQDGDDGHVRIKVVWVPVVAREGKVAVATLTRTGREIRRRWIDTSQLHAAAVTRGGAARRTGYILER